ncbi:serine/threonine-protein kinase ULK3 [Anopheles ziemanni]|uniref:serine/threonine-protein kinase ULK3 n=1 Tax=Anopheles coustani TaxID=139045 RepID=UPI002657FFA4|nr:serine/threonine-protein kinase ULK3 [Anopheles coustani]XP_058175929.1 serine/threonine-protein kinase ULK3 [Anopheles ziemanni]
MCESKITDYMLLERLGKGSYAVVHRAMKKDTQEICAVKLITNGTLSHSASDNIVSEISLLKKLKHQHIVEMRDFLWDEKNIYIVMEYCNAGNLSTYIKQHKTLNEGTCRMFLQQLALALRYMRANDVSHLDLKPANLLLNKTAGTFTLKVGDFGFAQRLKLNQENTTIKGTLLYMAPEILLTKSYGPSADLWSVGVILYECLFGRAPYSSASVPEFADRIRRNDPIVIPAQPIISGDCKTLLKNLLQRNPAERITFEQFFEHPFLDLRHVPSKENMEKAIKLINDAIRLEQEQDLPAAYRAYCQGLQYFVPITRAEADAAKKLILRQRVQTYLNRAEALKQRIYATSEGGCNSGGNPPPSAAQLPGPNEEAASASTAALNKPTTTTSALTKDLEKIAQGMKIARQADTDAQQNKLDDALSGYTTALGMLIPMLHKEIPPAQKKNLHQRIVHWMEEAEYIKSIRSAQIMEEVESSGSYGCILQ